MENIDNKNWMNECCHNVVDMFSYNVLRQRSWNFPKLHCSNVIWQRLHNFPSTLWQRSCNIPGLRWSNVIWQRFHNFPSTLWKRCWNTILLMPRSHIHRAPHDCSCPVLPGGLPWILETVGLPCEFNFCGVCGHIFYDVRAVPFKNWKSLIVRCP